MTMVTGASYGLPPLGLADMTAGANPANTAAPVVSNGAVSGTPIWHFAIPAYGAVLLIVAALYAWTVWRE